MNAFFSESSILNMTHPRLAPKMGPLFSEDNAHLFYCSGDVCFGGTLYGTEVYLICIHRVASEN